MRANRQSQNDSVNERFNRQRDVTDRGFDNLRSGREGAGHLLTLHTRSLDSSRPRGLQRQNRVNDREIELETKPGTHNSVINATPDKTLPQRYQQDNEYKNFCEAESDNLRGFINSERQSICKTLLVDPEGNIVSPEIQSLQPKAPTARIKYPGIRVDRSPSGVDPLDTNEFYKYRSRSLDTGIINDYRYDSSEDLAGNKPLDQKFMRQRTLDSTTPTTTSNVLSPGTAFCITGSKTFIPQTGSLDNPFYEPNVSNKSGGCGETIPLQDLTGPICVADYRKKFQERIRLKSRSLESRDQSVDHSSSKDFGISHVSLHDPSEARKTVAFKEPPNFSQSRVTKGDYIRRQASGDGSVQRLLNLQGDTTVLGAHESSLLSVEQRLPTIVASKSQGRLHNQSSTETSGLGETITSGCSSQESLAGYYGITCVETNLYEDQGIDLREEDSIKEGNGSRGKEIIDSNNIINDTNEQKESGNLPEIIVDGISCAGSLHTPYSTSLDNVLPGSSREFKTVETQNSQMKDIQIPTDTFKVRAYRPPPDFLTKDVKKPDSLKVHSVNVGPNFDDLFNQSRSHQQTVGLRLEQINNEWNKQKRGSSIKSRSSQGSFRSRSGSTRRSRRFLGHKESQWMKWGAERRASYRRRMEKLQKPEPEIPRASTPVKKARQEGLVFIHPDLESKYISEDDINYINRHKHERLKTYKLIEKSKVKAHHQDHGINRLTQAEMLVLSGFWGHRVFNRSRYLSILLSLATSVIYCICISSSEWVTYPSTEGK